MAAHEAIIAEFGKIEPPHLLLALLKFAEFDKKQFDQILQDRTLLGHLLSERDDVRRKLGACAVDVPGQSRVIRYGLRKKLGRGDHPHDGGAMIHRSEASRRVCKKAEKTARLAGSPFWCADHLLGALMASPEASIREAFQAAGITADARPPTTPFVDEYGIELKASVENPNDLPESRKTDIEKDPVLKVMAAKLKHPKEANTLIIRKGRRSARHVLADLLDSGLARDNRIIDLNLGKILSAPREPAGLSPSGLISALFEEACGTPGLILFFADFHAALKDKDNPGFGDHLKGLLARKRIRVIAATDEKNYRDSIEGDSGWREVFRPMWIHDLQLPGKL